LEDGADVAVVCDDDELSSGRRREGMFSAVKGFALKATQGLTFGASPLTPKPKIRIDPQILPFRIVILSGTSHPFSASFERITTSVNFPSFSQAPCRSMTRPFSPLPSKVCFSNFGLGKSFSRTDGVCGNQPCAIPKVKALPIKSKIATERTKIFIDRKRNWPWTEL
jgi:hypothetical protein